MKKHDIRAFVALAAFGCAALLNADIRALTPQIPDASWTKGWWQQRHADKMELVRKGGAPIVFIGDSITHFWETNGKAVWNRFFAEGRYRALNLGFSGDRTEHVLWRIEQGEISGYEAKAVVLMIGTNNTGHFPLEKETPLDTVLGVRAVIDRIREKQPKAKLLLCPIFPCDKDAKGQRRRRNNAVNEQIMRFADGKDVIWCDFTSQFLLADGTLPAAVFPDFLHPSEPGYELWAASILPFLDYALAADRQPIGNRIGQNFSSEDGKVPAPARAVSLIGRREHWWRDPEMWLNAVRRHRNATEIGSEYDLVLLGDSITRGWEGNGAAVLAELRRTYRVLSLGIGGDRVQHNIWRARYGELDGYSAKCVMLMIGTNNNYGDKPEQIAAGIKELLAEIRRHQPKAKILLSPVFPRGEKPDDPKRINNVAVNALIRPFADGKDVIWLDFNQRLLQADGTISKSLMPDFLHPLEAGYRIWAEEMAPHLKSICGR